MSDEAEAGPAEPTADDRPTHLGVSTIVAYLTGISIVVFLIDLAGPVRLAAFLRILDDLVDLGLVQLTDPDTGFVTVGLMTYELSRLPIRQNSVLVAVALVFGAILLRGLRFRLIADRAGIGDAVTEVGSCYYVGLGMNLLFPFGPGEFASVQTLTRNGADADAAVSTAYHARIFEVLALATGIFIGFLALGWGGTVVPIVITFVFLAVLTAIVRPFGRGGGERRSGVRGLFDWMNVTGVVQGVRTYFGRYPNHSIGVYGLSVVAIYCEVAGLWFLKQAFLNPPDIVLLANVTFVEFGLVIAAASLTRVVPFTPAAVGVYEALIVALFHFSFGEGILPAVTVAILDGLLLGFVTLLLFVYGLYRHDTNLKDTWLSFLAFSRGRERDHGRSELDTVVGGDAD